MDAIVSSNSDQNSSILINQIPTILIHQDNGNDEPKVNSAFVNSNSNSHSSIDLFSSLVPFSVNHSNSPPTDFCDYDSSTDEDSEHEIKEDLHKHEHSYQTMPSSHLDSVHHFSGHSTLSAQPLLVPPLVPASSIIQSIPLTNPIHSTSQPQNGIPLSNNDLTEEELLQRKRMHKGTSCHQ
jgi:hypothetical protein